MNLFRPHGKHRRGPNYPLRVAVFAALLLLGLLWAALHEMGLIK